LGTTSRSRPTHTEEARHKDRRPGGQDVKKSRNNAVAPKAEAKEVANATEKGTTRNVLPADGPYRLVERLAKRIARSGLCSRREAERLIEEVGTAFSLHHVRSTSRADLSSWPLVVRCCAHQGLVSVDGAIVKTPAINVTPASVVMINNKKVHTTGTFSVH
jgi:hypothetical protein